MTKEYFIQWGPMGIHIHKSQKVTNAFPQYIQVCLIKGDEKPQSSHGGFMSGSISLLF